MDSKKLAALAATVALGASLAVFAGSDDQAEQSRAPVAARADAAADGPIDMPLEQLRGANGESIK